ncbi:lantibiotic dehydratase [Actinospica durhamensis]|uniref:Lantibiotic dehydratase n=1 Tax=Actinospica durhamensis TaxID=1508375 RepID=A0A941ITJ8_9ACTN|nr:lantibiotic dehydratase [Actinospica durhamensis]MBR7836068.1 lantibiotic dehydratase [Actinospica durhamensis]
MLLRVPVLPRVRVRAGWLPEPDGPEETAALIRKLTQDPELLEAVELASASLGRTLRLVLAGRETRLPELTRAACSLTRYQLRMAARPTPFGLFAGVALAGFGPRQAGGIRGFGPKALQPEAAWLSDRLSAWEQDEQVLAGLRVAANDLCFVRGRRLIVPPGAKAEASGDEPPTPNRTRTERTLAHTPAVQAALEYAATAIAVPELQDLLAARFPRSAQETITSLIRKLISLGVLLTDLHPPLDVADPLAYVQRRLPAASAQAALVREIGNWCDGQAEARLGRPDADTPRPDFAARADLALETDVRLPECVAAELERVAELLCRISPGPTAPIGEYHQAFLERYGTARSVPLPELLDPNIGLGLPAAYRRTPGPGRVAGLAHPGEDAERHRILSTLLLDAAADGRREIELDPGLITELERLGGDEPGRTASGFDLFAELLARDAEALDAGRFTLLLSPVGIGPGAGAAFGRFAGLLGADPRIAPLAAAAGAARPGALPVGLVHPVTRTRFGNLCRTGSWLPDRLTVGVHAEPGPHTVSLGDLAVGADRSGFRIAAPRLGRELTPVAFHRLARSEMPTIARFLLDAAAYPARAYRPWDWGPFAQAPFLPAVRTGSTVLSPARWRLDDPVLLNRGTPTGDWEKALDTWLQRRAVPEELELVLADHRIPLHLAHGWHRAILRQEAVRGKPLELRADLFAEHGGPGWLSGPTGTHHAEIVVAILPHAPAVGSDAASPAPLPPVRRVADAITPGGPWLYVRLPSALEQQDEILAVELPRLLNRLPAEVDRWFFLRYLDPEPHLRLRFHADPETLAVKVLPEVRDWVQGLAAGGVARDFSVESYLPEIERYGGPDAIAVAEGVFHAGSVLAVRRLAARASTRGPQPDPLLQTAADLAFMARLYIGEADWAQWLCDRVPRSAEHHPAFAERRRAALAAVDPSNPLPTGTDFGQLVRLMPAYGALVRDLAQDQDWIDPDSVLLSVLHVQANRLLGVDRAAEAQAFAIARGAVQSHRDRAAAQERAGRNPPNGESCGPH